MAAVSQSCDLNLSWVFSSKKSGLKKNTENLSFAMKYQFFLGVFEKKEPVWCFPLICSFALPSSVNFCQLILGLTFSVLYKSLQNPLGLCVGGVYVQCTLW